jgi:hypothetical protein
MLDMSAAVRATAAIYPTALSFQAGDGAPNIQRSLIISNVGTAAASFQLSAVAAGGGPAPAVGTDSVNLDPGGSAQVSVTFSASALAPGAYEGFIRIADPNTGIEAHVPYWYAVRSDVPKFITVLNVQDGANPSASVRDAVLFRITDASGVAIRSIEPVVTVLSGDGTLSSVSSRDFFIPGSYGITLRLGPRRGANVVRIQAGDVVKDVSISSR